MAGVGAGVCVQRASSPQANIYGSLEQASREGGEGFAFIDDWYGKNEETWPTWAIKVNSYFNYNELNVES